MYSDARRALSISEMGGVRPCVPPRARGLVVAWAVGLASALVLAAQAGAAVQQRHLGSFGVVCAPQPGRAVSAVAAQPETRTPPRRLTVTLVIDLRCAS